MSCHENLHIVSCMVKRDCLCRLSNFSTPIPFTVTSTLEIHCSLYRLTVKQAVAAQADLALWSEILRCEFLSPVAGENLAEN